MVYVSAQCGMCEYFGNNITVDPTVWMQKVLFQNIYLINHDALDPQ